MRKKLNKTVTLTMIFCAVFINFQSSAFSSETGVSANVKKPVPIRAEKTNKSQVITNTLKIHPYQQVQKPNSFQLMPKIPAGPPLPNASKKITVKPAPVLTLNNFIKAYQKPYLNVYISTLSTLSDTESVTSYNSSKGEIKAKLKNGKELYVLVAPFQNNITKVRITPTDGVYNIPLETVRGIFSGINLSLAKH